MALPCLAAGVLGVFRAYGGEPAEEFLQDARLWWLAETGTDLAGPLLEAVVGAGPSGLLAAVGLGLLALALRPRRIQQLDPDGELRTARSPVREARRLTREGRHVEAAELLLAGDELEAAVEAFVRAGDLLRVAEIRHDQNRFLDAAECYIEAGEFESAAVIFAQQEAFGRAAECYLKIGSNSAAAEMFEKSEDFARAADCFRAAEFLSQAARCYVQCSRWRSAAECLEGIVREEGVQRGSGDAAKREELTRFARQAAALFLKADDPAAAMKVLETGGWDLLAAQLASKLHDFAKAAALFEQAGDREQAAKALRRLGDDAEAARLLGEHLRDQGDFRAAAEQLRAAGDRLGAGDLFRQIDEPGIAAECYAEHGDHAQAAEMHELLGDRDAAAAAWERAGRFSEAAECCALSGQGEREALFLERAGRFLEAGEAYQREGLDDQAIGALQRVEGDGFAKAASSIATIFRSRGQTALAIRQLVGAIGDVEVVRETLPMFYTLATLYEEDGCPVEALELYDRVAGVDYHHADVERRAARLRATVEVAPAPLHQRAAGAGFPGGAGAGEGRYEIVREVGRGGMGIVYEARDSVLDRRVAFKVLPHSFRENPQAVRNFLREAKAAAKLNHPNIVTVYDAGEQDGRYYIAMEYVDGTTLKDILSRRGALGTSGFLSVLIQLTGALACAHEQGVVHRDIKTSNAMWTRDRTAKIMDFGLARVVEEVRNHTTVVSGTPCYMSPEQTLGRNIDHRTDIYSLGVTSFELLTGRLPFTEGNIPYHHVHTLPPSIESLRADVPEAVAHLVARCLEKDAAKRFQSAREVLAAALELRGDTDPAGSA